MRLVVVLALLAAIAGLLSGCGTTPAPAPGVPYATPSITPTATPCGAACRFTVAVVAEGPPPTAAPPTPTTQPLAAAAAAGPVTAIGLTHPIGHYTPPDEQARIALEVGWPARLIPELLAVIECESHGQAVRNRGGGPYYGLLQLEGPFWFDWAGYPFDWTNPYVNLRVGWLVYGYYGGWGGWECQP